MKNNEIEKTNSRRSFMKKAAYAVPTIIAISQLTSPVAAHAGASQLTEGSPSVSTGTKKNVAKADSLFKTR